MALVRLTLAVTMASSLRVKPVMWEGMLMARGEGRGGRFQDLEFNGKAIPTLLIKKGGIL